MSFFKKLLKNKAKILLVFFCFFCVLVFLIFINKNTEDGWVCDDGIWVAHGYPASEPPEEGCEFEISTRELEESPVFDEKLEEEEVKEKLSTVSAKAGLWGELGISKMREIISDAVGWIQNSQEEDGHFKYEYSVLNDVYSEDDLMVRQTGVLHILGEVLERDRGKNFDLKDNMEKALSFFEENSAFGEMNGYRFRCVLRTSKICSLGGTALTLIGILDLIDVYPELGTKYSKQISDYLNFILAMKKPGEGFRGWYYYDTSQSEAESDYSNGEAFLALARYFEDNAHMSTMRIKEVKDVIDESFDYFEMRYGQNPNFNFYLWGMAAIKELSKFEPNQRYFDFVSDYTEWRMNSYKNRRDSILNYCAYFEGVISAYSVLEPDLNEYAKNYYLEEINYWLSRSQKLQVDNSGYVDLVFGGNETRMKVLDTEKAKGGFLTALNDPVQRIDYTQHCLSSYLQKLVDIDGEEL
jgi:hypothetical protein